MATKNYSRPESNKDYRVLNKKTGKWELVKGKPTEPETRKVYASMGGKKYKGYWESMEELVKRINKPKKVWKRKRQYI